MPLSAGCEAGDALGVLCKAAQQTAGIEQWNPADSSELNAAAPCPLKITQLLGCTASYAVYEAVINLWLTILISSSLMCNIMASYSNFILDIKPPQSSYMK